MGELIYYVGPFSFPDGGAAARRIYGNINSLRELGYDVKVIDGDASIGKRVYDGIDVISVGERPTSKDHIIKKIKKYLFIGQRTINFIVSQKRLPKYIFLYGGYSPYLTKLLFFCKKYNIKLIFDCVEWYQPKSVFEYLYKPYYWNIELSMRVLIPKCDGLICISRFLDDFYSKNCEAVNIPPTLLMSNVPKKKECYLNGRVRLVYSGSPGHKDYLSTIVSAVSELSHLYELDIAGVSGVNIENVRYHGFISHAKSLQLVSDSHFSILLRPYNRVSKAGFSTKVVESMSCGTPVITNDTGDLIDFIADGRNGYIFHGINKEDLIIKLRSIADSLKKNNYIDLSNSAYAMAVDKFDCRNYSKSISSLLSKI
jgi:glycosyltransferase involved in cell wall biosynthesis